MKAIKDLADGTAPGPEMFPSILKRKLAFLVLFLVYSDNGVSPAGLLPQVASRLSLIPYVNSGKDTDLRESQMLFLFPCAIAGVIESITYHRALPVVEPQARPAQCAYRRNRGAGMLLAGLVDFADRALFGGSLCFVVSSDISSVFGDASHWNLVVAPR